jgi:hypothetical protein
MRALVRRFTDRIVRQTSDVMVIVAASLVSTAHSVGWRRQKSTHAATGLAPPFFSMAADGEGSEARVCASVVAPPTISGRPTSAVLKRRPRKAEEAPEPSPSNRAKKACRMPRA